MNKYTENLEKVGNKYRIVETMQISTNQITKLPIKESKVKVGEKEYKVSNAYRFKIWDSDPTEKGFNANGRNYCNVIDKIVESNPTTLSMADHPEDGKESVKDYCGVEKNVRVDDDGWMSYEFIPIGEYGKNIVDIIENGGFIEMSSSILGDIDDNGYIIRESVELERLGDWVVNCSNRLLQYSNKTEIHTDEGVNEMMCEEGCINENITIDNDESSIVKEHKDNAIEEKGETMSDKLVETSMKMNILSLVKDAEKIENLYEKKDSLMSAHSYANELSDKTLANEIQEKVNAIDSELKVLSEKGMKTDELSNSVKELTESKTNLEKEITEMKAEKDKLEKQLHTIAEMYEEKQYKAGETEILKNRRLAKEVCSLKLKVRKQETENERAKTIIKNLKNKLVILEANANTSKVDIDEFVALQEENEKLSSTNKMLENKIRKMRIDHFEEKKESESRFRIAQRKLMKEKLEDNKIDNSKSKIVENETNEDDEDLMMEKMLNGTLKA